MDEIRDLPPIIRRALARAVGCDVGGLNELGCQERMLLARYVRNVNTKDVRASVRVGTATLGVAMHLSDRTILRLKTELIARGWITTHQVQSRKRGMQISDVTLTDHALTVLGFLEKVSEKSESASAKMADAFCLSQSFTKSHSQGEAFLNQVSEIAESGLTFPPLPEVEQPIRPPAQPQECIEEKQEQAREQTTPAQPKPTVDTRGVPTDLAVLSQAGLNRFAIFKLMAMATRKGKRLGDIVKALASDTLLKAKNLFCYMRKLISIDRDWATYKAPAILKREAEEEAMKRQQARTAALDIIRKACEVTGAITNFTRQTFWKFDEEACAVYAWKAESRVPQYVRVLEVERMAASVQTGRLFPATP